MIITPDNYREFPAIANSDLSWLEKQLMPKDWVADVEQAFRMGSLIDAMITEPHRVDFFQRKLDNDRYEREDFERAKQMKQAFRSHKAYENKSKFQFVMDLVDNCSFQHISYQPAFEVDFEGYVFQVPAKCKWDLKKKMQPFGGDIKSTTATTLDGCMQAIRHFNYDRSRAWYMDIEGHEMDCLIFISKVNFKVFVIPFNRQHWIYREGRAKYQELCFKYWSLFFNDQKKIA